MRTTDRTARTTRAPRRRRIVAAVTVACIAASVAGCALPDELSTGFEADLREQAITTYGAHLEAIAAMSQSGAIDSAGLEEHASPDVAADEAAWVERLAASGVVVERPPTVERVRPVAAGGVAGHEDILCLDLDEARLVDAAGATVDPSTAGFEAAVVVRWDRTHAWTIEAVRPATADESRRC